MSEPADFEAARWSAVTHADQHQPANALKAALRDIEAGTVEPQHVIVVMAHDQDGKGMTRYYQAGEFCIHARIGLLERAKQIMED